VGENSWSKNKVDLTDWLMLTESVLSWSEKDENSMNKINNKSKIPKIDFSFSLDKKYTLSTSVSQPMSHEVLL
jgi:hypothetical protein